MKILETQSAALTNFEALRHLRAVDARYRAHPDYAKATTAKLRNLHAVVGDSLTYLGASPSPSAASTYSVEAVGELVTRLKPFALTKAEVLMLCNLRPADVNALELLVEEAESRFEAEQLERIVVIVAEVLGATDEKNS